MGRTLERGIGELAFENMFKNKRTLPQNRVRKERSDKLKQVKINVDLPTLRLIHKLSRSNGMSINQFTTTLIVRSLKYKNNEMYYGMDFKGEYPGTEYMVSCKLPKRYHDEVAIIAGNWMVSIKRAAHRILYFELQKGGIHR